MRVGMILLLLINVGCASGIVQESNDLTASQQHECSTGQPSSKSELKECPARKGWWRSIGEALGGMATALPASSQQR
jgi:hypothetical protein